MTGESGVALAIYFDRISGAAISIPKKFWNKSTEYERK